MPVEQVSYVQGRAFLKITFLSNMKKCPQCGRTYTDEALIYCLNDGTLLSVSTASVDPQATLVLPPARQTEPFPNVAPPTQGSQPQIVRQGVRPAVVYVLVALLA